MILAFPFFLNSRIIVFSHTNHTEGFTAVFCNSEAISAHAGSKFLAMMGSIVRKIQKISAKLSPQTSRTIHW